MKGEVFNPPLGRQLLKTHSRQPCFPHIQKPLFFFSLFFFKTVLLSLGPHGIANALSTSHPKRKQRWVRSTPVAAATVGSHSRSSPGGHSPETPREKKPGRATHQWSLSLWGLEPLQPRGQAEPQALPGRPPHISQFLASVLGEAADFSRRR